MSTLKADTWQNTDGTENYKCRAWVNFNGTGTVAIRAAGNVSSITDNGTGDYTVNFTNAMPDANFIVSGVCGPATAGTSAAAAAFAAPHNAAQTVSSVRCAAYVSSNNTLYDPSSVNVAIFR